MGYNPAPPAISRRPPPPKGQSGQSGLNIHNDNKCPNCGAMIKQNTCEYCGYRYNSSSLFSDMSNGCLSGVCIPEFPLVKC